MGRPSRARPRRDAEPGLLTAVMDWKGGPVRTSDNKGVPLRGWLWTPAQAKGPTVVASRRPARHPTFPPRCASRHTDVPSARTVTRQLPLARPASTYRAGPTSGPWAPTGTCEPGLKRRFIACPAHCKTDSTAGEENSPGGCTRACGAVQPPGLGFGRGSRRVPAIGAPPPRCAPALRPRRSAQPKKAFDDACCLPEGNAEEDFPRQACLDRVRRENGPAGAVEKAPCL